MTTRRRKKPPVCPMCKRPLTTTKRAEKKRKPLSRFERALVVLALLAVAVVVFGISQSLVLP